MTETKERNRGRTEPGEEKGNLFTRVGKWFRSDAFRCVLMDLAASLIILCIFFIVCVPKKYDLAVNSIAPETIKATKDVVDEVTTQERRDAAASKEIKYKDIREDLLSSLDSAFSELRTLQQYGASFHDAENPETVRREYTEEEIEQAFIMLDQLNLNREQVIFIMRMNSADFETMVSGITDAVSEELNNNTIREDQADQIPETIQRITGKKELEAWQTILPVLLEISIRPNLLIDQEATEEARQKAMDAVEPVIYQQGRTIVREGDPVEEWQLAMMRSLGIVNDQSINGNVYIGAIVAVLVSMLCLFMSLKLLRADVLTDIRKMAVILIVLILCMAFAAIAHLLPSQYIIPLAMGSILCTVLIGYRTGICVTITLSLLFGALTSGNSSSSFYDVVMMMSMTLGQGMLAIWYLKGHPQRVHILLAGALSALLGVAMLAALKWLTSSDSVDILSIGLWTIAGGVLSGLLSVAFQPAIEQPFRLATPSRLMELTNPSQPLMKRLMIEAPGTYHHSIIVANLAESAATRIKANPYLARAGAYYHDIGKLKRPMYFKENQMGDNPHEHTDPTVSAAIVISHTKDGMLLAQKEHIPQEIQNIILQHHGVTPVMFFYHKALQLSNGQHVDINEFRYAGPKPDTKEAAIVMLADTIEAAVRSMKSPTPKAIDQFIERLVRGKLEDGQLSDSPLSLRDIDEICEAFSDILKGVYHERIEYPNIRHYASQAAACPEPAPELQAPAQNPAAVPAEAAPAPVKPLETSDEEITEDSGKTATAQAILPEASVEEDVPEDSGEAAVSPDSGERNEVQGSED